VTDFRKMEHFLARFFANHGFTPTAAGGELYIGVASTRYKSKVIKIEGGADATAAHVVIDNKPDTEIISLSDLARELAALSGEGQP